MRTHSLVLAALFGTLASGVQIVSKEIEEMPVLAEVEREEAQSQVAAKKLAVSPDAEELLKGIKCCDCTSYSVNPPAPPATAKKVAVCFEDGQKTKDCITQYKPTVKRCSLCCSDLHEKANAANKLTGCADETHKFTINGYVYQSDCLGGYEKNGIKDCSKNCGEFQTDCVTGAGQTKKVCNYSCPQSCDCTCSCGCLKNSRQKVLSSTDPNVAAVAIPGAKILNESAPVEQVEVEGEAEVPVLKSGEDAKTPGGSKDFQFFNSSNGQGLSNLLNNVKGGSKPELAKTSILEGEQTASKPSRRD